MTQGWYTLKGMPKSHFVVNEYGGHITACGIAIAESEASDHSFNRPANACVNCQNYKGKIRRALASEGVQ